MEKLFPNIWRPWFSCWFYITHFLKSCLSNSVGLLNIHWHFLSLSLIYLAMVPEYWLTEGGQSASGALLDYILENHVASQSLANRAASRCEMAQACQIVSLSTYSHLCCPLPKISHKPFVFWGISTFELLNEILEKMLMNEILESMKLQEVGSPFLAVLTKDLHVLPDFHGNRWELSTL